MAAKAIKVQLGQIQSLRALFLQESNFQVRYNACHERGWTDSYLLAIDGMDVGYGSVKGQETHDRDTVFEFYVAPPHRRAASAVFAELLAQSRVKYVECQSNDPLLSPMLYEFAQNIGADTVIFEDHAVTTLAIPGAVVRPRRSGDRMGSQEKELDADYVLELQGEIRATGGFLTHYNVPFADLYMAVRPDCRGRGYASFLLQEVKKACYAAGRVPAARCNIANQASRAALIKGGLRVCGFMLRGDVKKAE
jgi:GNAT superfamily N-acetyltransferase